MAIRIHVDGVPRRAGRNKFVLSNPLHGCSLHGAPCRKNSRPKQEERSGYGKLGRPARSSVVAPRRNCRSSRPYNPRQISAYDSERIRETTEGGDATEKGSNAVEQGARFCAGRDVVGGARTIEYAAEHHGG